MLIGHTDYTAETYQTWVYTKGLFEEDVGTRYLAALYWAFATMSTAGYGDVSAVNNTERVAPIVCMVFGVTIFGQSSRWQGCLGVAH